MVIGIILCVPSPKVCAQNDEQQPPAGSVETMAAVPYSVGGKERWLTLVKQTIPWPWDRLEQLQRDPNAQARGEITAVMMEQLRYFSDPNAPTPFNLAFLVVDSPTKEIAKGKVVAVMYDHFSEEKPDPVWHGQLVWRADRKEALAIILEGSRRVIRVFRIDPTQEFGVYPLRLEPKNRSEWPQPVPLFSEFKKEPRDISGDDWIYPPVEKIKLSIEQEILQIQGIREDKEHPPLLLRFDLKTKEWQESPQK
jgi:hypothetical protein